MTVEPTAAGAGAASPAEMYERLLVPAIFAPCTRSSIERARPRRGERALDLDCGTGIVARNLAPALGDDGSVAAIDLRPAMLAVARALPRPTGAPIAWLQADANQAFRTSERSISQEGRRKVGPSRSGSRCDRRGVFDG